MKHPLVLSVTALLLAGCVGGNEVATQWGGGGRYLVNPYGPGYIRVATRGPATASIATYGNVTSVSTSAAKDIGSTLVTDGTRTTLASQAGGAESALATSGSNTVMAVSTTNASASLWTDGTTSHGEAWAGTTTSTW
jgi:hypothetical protein